MIKNQFQLERGNAENRVRLSVEAYKKVTGFNKTETILKDIKLELPDIPNINEFNKLSLNRDKKIEKEIIKPKDELIEKLHQDNIRLYKELDKQVEIISKAEEVEKENVKLKKQNNTYIYVILQYKYENDNQEELENEYDEELEN